MSSDEPEKNFGLVSGNPVASVKNTTFPFLLSPIHVGSQPGHDGIYAHEAGNDGAFY